MMKIIGEELIQLKEVNFNQMEEEIMMVFSLCNLMM